MLFGSDWPVITPDRWLRDFEKLDIKPDVRPLILKENAIKLLGLARRERRARASRSFPRTREIQLASTDSSVNPLLGPAFAGTADSRVVMKFVLN